MRRVAKSALLGGLLIFCAVVALKGAALLVPSGTWAPEGTMANARSGASAALLPDGRILITGGDTGSGPAVTADILDTNGATSAAPPMVSARSKHVSVTLQDGRVLVAGGITAGGSATNTAEIFDPVANSWTNVGIGMTEARSSATAALLPDGRVLIAGGQNGTAISSTIEIFDPVLGAFTPAGMMTSPRTQHAMAVLQDGRVIIAGGNNGTAPVASTDIFDPVAGTVSAGPSLATARFGHSATTLLNGQVLIIGGNNGNANPLQMDMTPAELFDPAAGTFTTLTTNLATPREGHLAILLPNNNNVLIVGGTSGGATIASAELFSQWQGTFAATGTMATARSSATGAANQVNVPTSITQRNGLVMVAGGTDASGNALNTTEAYGYPTVQTDQADYPPGSIVTITGSGWKPGETVTLTLVESPFFDTHPAMTAVADASGNIVNTQFSPDIHDIDIRFYLTAAGGTSNFQAQNTFTDSANKSIFSDANNTTVTTSFGSIAANQCRSSFLVALQGSGLGTPPSPATAALSSSPGGATFFAGAGCTGSSVTSVTVPSGQSSAAFSFRVASSGPYTIGGVGNWDSGGNHASATVTVTAPAATTTGISAPTITYNANGSVTVTVGSTAGTVTGNVTLSVDGGTAVPKALSGGSATFTSTDIAALASPSAGNYSLSASYAAQGSFGASSATGILTVNAASTSSIVTSSANPSVFGQSVTFTATVSAIAPGAGTPTGTVTFKDGATTLGTGALNGSGQASFSTSSLSMASHSITAVYGGDADFNATGTGASTATALSQVVNKADTTTSVTSSANPSVFGESVTFTAAVAVVSPGSGIPTGTVTFKDGATTLGTGALNGSGQATFTTSSLLVATHSISVSYGGDGNFNATGADAGSTATGLSQVVNKADTTTSVTSSANPSVFGESVTFTAAVAVVSPGSGIPTGTVTFKDGATTLGTGALNGSGQATFTTSSLLVATHSISVSYGGDGNFNATGADAGSTATGLSQVVNKADTTTSVTSSANPSVFGESVTFTAAVAVVSPGSGIPTGTVTFKDGATTLGTGALNGSGQATFTTSSLLVATHSISVSYGGDGNFNATGADAGSTATGLSQVVNKADTTTSVTSSANPSVFGESVTFTAAVAVVSPGSGIPTGTVTFKDGATTLGTGALNGSGQATFTTSSLLVATHSISVSYGGDGNFNATGADAGSTATGLSQVVNKADTTTSVTSSANPSVFGESVTFTAAVAVVSPGSGIPTGTVTFKDGATTLGTGALNGSGQATFTTSSLLVATHSISVSYGGDGNFNATGADAGSTATGLSQVVNKADTTTSVTSSANPSVFGESVTFTAAVAVVSPGSGIPTGTVTFKDGATTLGTGTLNGSGQASFSTSSLSVASHSITAVYGGDADFNATGTGASTATALSQVVNKADTSSTVASSANPSVFGQSVTFTATVSAIAPGAGTPTGTVTFKDGATTVGTGTLNGSGQASFSTSSLSVASHSITAVYGGDADFNATGTGASTATALSQVVNKADTSSTVASSANPSVFGQSVTFTATVSAVAPGTGTPSGTVDFKDGVTTIAAGVTLSGGQASFSTSSLSVASHSITAVYGGDADFNATGTGASTATALSQVVNKADTSSTVASSANPSVFGQSVTFTATVSAIAPGAGTPTGTVTFKDGVTTIAAGVMLSGGQASFSTSTFAVGSHIITAVYIGDADFNATGTGASTAAPLTQQVNFGFVGFGPPYAPPPTTFNVTRTMPLKWQYTNSSGAVVNSASANPVILINGPYACGGSDTAGTITVNDAGASGYQYDPGSNSWQFNWQIKGNVAGCYDIYVKSQQSGQTNGAFPISLVNK